MADTGCYVIVINGWPRFISHHRFCYKETFILSMLNMLKHISLFNFRILCINSHDSCSVLHFYFEMDGNESFWMKPVLTKCKWYVLPPLDTSDPSIDGRWGVERWDTLYCSQTGWATCSRTQRNPSLLKQRLTSTQTVEKKIWLTVFSLAGVC